MLLQAARGLQDEDLTGTGARSRVQVSTDLGEGETKVWRNPNLPQHLSGGGSYGETRGLDHTRVVVPRKDICVQHSTQVQLTER